MRYFLVILFAWLPFFAQAQVVLSDKVARFYLERHYTAITLQEQVRVRAGIISNLNSQIIQKDAIINAYVNDRAVYEDMLRLKDEEQALLGKDLKSLRKEAGKQRLQKKFLLAGIVILTVITTVK